MATTPRPWAHRYWFHIVMGSCLILLMMRSDSVVKAYYNVVLRPQLLARGAARCDTYRPVSGTSEDTCDLVSVTRRNGETTEIFEGADGLVETTVVSVNGDVKTRERSFRSNKLWMLFPGAGVVLYAALIINRVIRFGVAFVRFKRHPPQRGEWIVLFYAVFLVVASIAVAVLGG